jgi:hypothetical protein
MLYKTVISTTGCTGPIPADRLLKVDEATVAWELEKFELEVDKLLGVLGV